MAKNIEQVINEATDKLLQAVEVYGPKATELVLETGRIAAVQEIVSGFVFLLVLLIACVIGTGCIWKIVNLPKYDGAIIGWGIGAIGCAGVATVGLIGSSIGLVNMFAWVGMRHPEIYLAAKLLKL